MLRRQTNLIIRSRLTHKHSGVTLVHTSFGRIHPDTSLIALLSFKFAWDPFFVISSFKEEPAEGSPRLRLRRRPRSGPPSPAPSYRAFPRPPSAGWPGGCRTPAPSSPRSSATQETEHSVYGERQSCRDSSLSTLKYPEHQRWNQHQPCSSRVKAELGAFYTEMKPILLILLSRFYCLQAVMS